MKYIPIVLYAFLGFTLSQNGINFTNGSYWLILFTVSMIDLLSHINAKE